MLTGWCLPLWIFDITSVSHTNETTTKPYYAKPKLHFRDSLSFHCNIYTRTPFFSCSSLSLINTNTTMPTYLNLNKIQTYIKYTYIWEKYFVCKCVAIWYSSGCSISEMDVLDFIWQNLIGIKQPYPLCRTRRKLFRVK